jgi:hypothetical protein
MSTSNIRHFRRLKHDARFLYQLVFRANRFFSIKKMSTNRDIATAKKETVIRKGIVPAYSDQKPIERAIISVTQGDANDAQRPQGTGCR